jgi:hypothetical protein
MKYRTQPRLRLVKAQSSSTLTGSHSPDCHEELSKARPTSPGAQASPFLRLRSLLAIPALLVCLLGISLVGAALSPGNQSFEAKWADWLRAHHAGLVARRFEELYYSATAPAKRGRTEEPQQGAGDGRRHHYDHRPACCGCPQ